MSEPNKSGISNFVSKFAIGLTIIMAIFIFNKPEDNHDTYLADGKLTKFASKEDAAQALLVAHAFGERVSNLCRFNQRKIEHPWMVKNAAKVLGSGEKLDNAMIAAYNTASSIENELGGNCVNMMEVDNHLSSFTLSINLEDKSYAYAVTNQFAVDTIRRNSK